jgi:hypothetical protein
LPCLALPCLAFSKCISFSNTHFDLFFRSCYRTQSFVVITSNTHLLSLVIFSSLLQNPIVCQMLGVSGGGGGGGGGGDDDAEASRAAAIAG